MKYLLLVAALLFAGLQLQAQNLFAPNSKGSTYGLSVGYSSFGHKNLYSDLALKTYGYPEFSATGLNFGLEGSSITRSVIMGIEFSGTMGMKNSRSSSTSFFSDGVYTTERTQSLRPVAVQLNLNLGYLFFTKERFSAYFLTGMGLNGFGFWMNDDNPITKDKSYPGFVQEKALTDNQALMYILSPGFNFALGANYFLGGERNATRANGFMLGLRLGYSVQMPNDKWTLNGDQPRPEFVLPEHANNMFYVKLIIGGGDIYRAVKKNMIDFKNDITDDALEREINDDGFGGEGE